METTNQNDIYNDGNIIQSKNKNSSAICIYPNSQTEIRLSKYVKLASLVEADPKAPFSTATHKH